MRERYSIHNKNTQNEKSIKREKKLEKMNYVDYYVKMFSLEDITYKFHNVNSRKKKLNHRFSHICVNINI